MKKPLIFSRERWRELRASDDPLTREIVALMDKRGIPAVIDRVEEIDGLIFVPQRKKRGAPSKWENGGVLYAWLEVEIQLRLAKIKNSKATPRAVMKGIFRKLKGQPLRVLPNSDEGIKNDVTACRLHSTGKRLLAGNPTLSTRWHRMVERVVAESSSR